MKEKHQTLESFQELFTSSAADILIWNNAGQVDIYLL